MLVGAGAAEGAVDAANILKPALARGEIAMRSARRRSTSTASTSKSDAALERSASSRCCVEEPSNRGDGRDPEGRARPKYEEHHKLKIISDEALHGRGRALVALRWLTASSQTKSIDLMDEASCAGAHPAATQDAAVGEARRSKGLESDPPKEKDTVDQSNQQYEYAAELREREVRLQAKLEELEQDEVRHAARAGHEADSRPKRTLRDVVSMWTGIPALAAGSPRRPRTTAGDGPSTCATSVIGQDEPVTAVAKAVRRALAPGSRTRSVRSASSSSSGRRAWGKPTWRSTLARVHVRLARQHR